MKIIKILLKIQIYVFLHSPHWATKVHAPDLNGSDNQI